MDSKETDTSALNFERPAPENVNENERAFGFLANLEKIKQNLEILYKLSCCGTIWMV
jgi:hypothetical protein